MKKNIRSNRLVHLMVCGLLLGLVTGAALAQVPDPGVRGPRAVTSEVYTFGDTAFRPASSAWPRTFSAIEVTGIVHYPTDLSEAPYPVVVFLHGWHPTCYDSARRLYLAWPCRDFGLTTIESYRGYDYLGEVLASHGFIVISVSANGINARDNSLGSVGISDVGMGARAQLVQHHLDRWNTFNTTGGYPTGSDPMKFVGKLDMTNIGTMGHSRGGEGVATNYVLNVSLGSPYGINAIIPVEAVNFHRPALNNVALMVLLGYCDGDVSDLQAMHYYDDTRYNVPGDPAPKHVVLVMGANHAFYNTIWSPPSIGSWDDWFQFAPQAAQDPFCGSVPGNQRLSTERQKGTGLAYMVGFYRLYLKGEFDFFPQFTGDAPPPPSATTDQIFVSYHPPDDPSSRLDVNRVLTATNLTSNTLGGAVTQSGLTPYDLCGGPAPQPRSCLPSVLPWIQNRQPHTTISARATSRTGLSQLRAGWTSSSAQYTNELPEGTRDVSGYSALQFRAGVNPSDSRNPAGIAQDLSVTLTDGAGNSATTLVSNWSGALFYPPGRDAIVTIGTQRTATYVPKAILNTVRIPLFAFDGVDVTDIRTVTFQFDQTASGALLISDVAFAY